MNRTRILIAEDHVLVAEAYKQLLEPEFEVVGIVSDGLALLSAVVELRSHVVLVDISMPRLNGLDAGEQLKQKNRSLKLIYVTMNVRADVAAEAFRRGASGYVLKHCSHDELRTAVRQVIRNQSYLSPRITKETVEFLLRSRAEFQEVKRISGRQSQVLQLLVEGKSMKEVAYTLQLRPGTVAYHKYKIMETLGIRSNAELIEYAMRQHMVG
jgi:DNA-binding NarL/FixJ family response regulator